MCVLAHSSAAPRGLTSGRQAVFFGQLDDGSQGFSLEIISCH